jgi:hemoglobin
VDWSEHLPKLTAFWCRALLGIDGYTGNPFRAHSTVNHEAPLTEAHFQRWLDLFQDAVELGWTGPIALRALNLAHNVARVHGEQLIGRSDPASATAALG